MLLRDFKYFGNKSILNKTEFTLMGNNSEKQMYFAFFYSFYFLNYLQITDNDLSKNKNKSNQF